MADCWLVPLEDRLLLEKIESHTRGTLHIPQALSSEESQLTATPTQRCIVIEGHATVLDNDKMAPTTLCAGHIVYIARHTGYTVEDDQGRELIVVEVKDILLLERQGVRE